MGLRNTKVKLSINEFLELGPCLLPLLYDILLRLRLEPIAITANIKQAFLQISVAKEHQSFLRFLWFDDIFDIDPSIMVYRFTRVIFGLNSSPLLLNGTLKVYFSKLLQQQIYEIFILEKLLRDLYVDDLASSFKEEKQAFRFYETSKDILSIGGFELRKWNTNCEHLQDFINNDTKEAIDENCIKKILGLDWNITSDEFMFYFTDIINTASNLPITKRNVLKLSSMFFDPLGLISPIVLQMKILFKEACALKCTWDDVLNDKSIEKWKKFFKELENLTSIKVGRYLFTNQYGVIEFELHGFCDASIEADSASVYVRLCKNDINTTNLVTAKSKIVTSKKLKVPKLELMSCLLLSRLIVSVKKALSVEVNITKVVSWSDSKVALWWIKSVNKKLKLWVENTLSEIQENVGVDYWCYVSTECNPIDRATWCNKKVKLNEVLWFKGESFLTQHERGDLGVKSLEIFLKMLTKKRL